MSPNVWETGAEGYLLSAGMMHQIASVRLPLEFTLSCTTGSHSLSQ
jgi:hypothetical protein